MMKKITRYLIIGIVFLLSTSVHSHAAIKKLAQTGFGFLDIAVGARPAAMGNAFIMVGNDANAMFFNPAGIGYMESNFDVFGSITSWIADINYSAAGLVYNAGNLGNFGVSLVSADYGDIYGTQYSETASQGYVETGKINTGAYAIGLAYARKLTNKFTVGGHLKYTYQHLGSNMMPDDEKVKNEASGIAVDFGTIFYPGFKSFRLGMSITNFSPEYKYFQEAFQLPLTFKVGMGMDMLDLFGSPPDHSLVLDIEGIHPRDYTQRLHIGGEYWFRNLIAFRGGYKFNYDEAGLNAGVGFNFMGVKLDYAYSNFGRFNAVNRFSVGVTF